MKNICVIGSLNMDLVVNVDTMPKPGQTLSPALIEKIAHLLPFSNGLIWNACDGILEKDK